MSFLMSCRTRITRDTREIVDMDQNAYSRDTLSGQDVLDILEDIRDKTLAAREAGLDFPELVLMPKMSMLEGRTRYRGRDISGFFIGTAELRENRDAEFELGVAMVPVVGAFHEICDTAGKCCASSIKILRYRVYWPRTTVRARAPHITVVAVMPLASAMGI